MVGIDKRKGSGWWIFRLPKDDPYQAGSQEHDNEFVRKAKGLPTARGRVANDDLLEREWEKELQTILRPNQDAFARIYEAGRQKLFRGFIRIAELFLWKSGRVNKCELNERGECPCVNDLDKYGNTRE